VITSALTTGIPSSHDEDDTFFEYLQHKKSRREKRLKPCSKTTKFSKGLHCQAHKRRRTEVFTGYLASSDSWCWIATWDGI
jgi:hypothetical protein